MTVEPKTTAGMTDAERELLQEAVGSIRRMIRLTHRLALHFGIDDERAAERVYDRLGDLMKKAGMS